MKTFDGQCFCGSIGFEYRTGMRPADWSIRACQCAFCRAHDALSTSDPSGELCFTAARPQNLQRYRFALCTADFLLCRECGVYIGAVIEADQVRFGIINTHALRDTPANLAEVGPISYESEDKSGRVDRRTRRWTPVIDVPWKFAD